MSSSQNSMGDRQLGRYLTLAELCTCTQTYHRYADLIDPFPKNLAETLPALEQLCHHILDPVIEAFGRSRFELTYGFCSTDLKRFLAQHDPQTGLKNGRVTPSLDQHMAHEINRNGRYFCDRLGAACDFRILDMPSNRLVDWIVDQHLPFDSLYYYSTDDALRPFGEPSRPQQERPIHVSYGPLHRRAIWTFAPSGVPTGNGVGHWRARVQQSAKLEAD